MNPVYQILYGNLVRAEATVRNVNADHGKSWPASTLLPARSTV